MNENMYISDDSIAVNILASKFLVVTEMMKHRWSQFLL